jgi:hypothetical protein
MDVKSYLQRAPSWVVTLFAALAAFFTYLCFYPFRRAYTAATYEDLYYFGVHFKILIITAQVLGFAVSKGIGVKVVSEMRAEQRPKGLLLFTGTSLISMYLFSVTPAPYNLFFVFLASLPLGLFYGVILGFLEGRKSTDFLVAALTASFIVGSGFAKTVGNYVLQHLSSDEFKMPFLADVIMYGPLLFFVWMLAQVPAPSAEDKQDRAERLPMSRAERKGFMREFGLGMVLFVISYSLLTAYREFRDNFMPEMFGELGFSGKPALFTQTEIPIAVAILLIMAAMQVVKNHRKAFAIIQGLLLLGALIIAGSTFLYQAGQVSAIVWLIAAGFGAYLAYSMCNSIYFERMLASFKYVGTVGFMITLADYYAYFGSLGVLFYKNFFQHSLSNLNFFIGISYAVSAVYFMLVLFSIMYFRKKAVLRSDS